MRTKVVAVLLIVLSFLNKGKAQTDTAFWFAMPHVIGGVGRDTPILFRIMPVDVAATVRIYLPADRSVLDTTVLVPAGGVKSINVTKFKELLENMPHGRVLNRGIKIESDQLVTAYFDEASNRNPEIYALKGVNALGTAFYVPGQKTYNNNTGDGTRRAYNSFDIVATEDNTVVTITLTNDIIASDGTSVYKRASDGPFTITLNKGQTFSCRATGQNASAHLGGSTVMSDKQVAVTMVDDFVAVEGCSDASGDQLVPVTIFGTEYASVAGYFSQNDRASIMATKDFANTRVVITRANGTTQTLNLGPGETYEFAYASNTNAAVYIKSDNPIAVMHMTGIGCELSYAVLPPLGSCIGSKKVGIVRPGNYETFLILVAPKVNAANAIASGFRFNNSATVIKSTDFRDLPGNSLWQYARVQLSLTDYPAGSAALITNTQNIKFHAGIIYGTSGVGGSYGYFSSYAIAPTVYPPNDTVFCNGATTGELKFTSTVNNSYFEWSNSDTRIGLAASGSGNIPSFVAVNNTNATIVARISVVPRANDCDGIPRSFTITVHPNPKLVVSATPAPVCEPGSINITADSLTNKQSTPGMTLRYYLDRYLRDTVLNPRRVTKTGWYYLQGRSAAGCLSNIDSVYVTISKKPDFTTNNPAPVCPGDSTDLTAAAVITGGATGWQYEYFIDPLIGSKPANPKRVPKGTYYIIATAPGGCTSDPKPVEATERNRAIAGNITINDSTVCKGDSVLLRARTTISGPTFTWYRDSALTIRISTGATLNTKAVNADSTYYITVSNTDYCANTAFNGKKVTVKMKRFALAADVVVRDTTICADGRVRLTASSATEKPGNNTIYKWYSDKGLTTIVATNKTYTTPVLTDSKTYYITVQNDSVCANQANNGDSAMVKVKPYGAKEDITISDTFACVGSTVKLSVTASTRDTIKWYSDATLTNLIDTGRTYTTPAITGDTWYYLAIEGQDYCKNASGAGTEVLVKKRDYADPTSISVKDTSVCEGGIATLRASTSLSGGLLKWYLKGNLNDTLRTGTTYTTAAVTGTKTYVVTVENAVTCATPAGVEVKVTKLNNAGTRDVTVAGGAVCYGDSILLTANTAVANTVSWYKDSALTVKLKTNKDYLVKPVTGDSVFYVTVQSAKLCENKPVNAVRVDVTKKAYGIAGYITVADARVCKGTTTLLTASTTTSGDIKWYKDSTLLERVATGTSYQTDAIYADTTKYYLTVSGDTLCENKSNTGAIVTVLKNEYATDADILAADTSVCKGNTVALTVRPATTIGSGGTFKWYADKELQTPVATATNTYTTGAVNANDTVYVTVEKTDLCANKAFAAKAIAITAKEYATADSVTVAGVAICTDTKATLSAVSKADSIKWYTNPDLTGLVHVGKEYTTDVITANTTYYVTVVSKDYCENRAADAAQVTVTALPYALASDITVTDATVCQGAPALLTATSTKGDIKWYSDAKLEDSLTTGTTFNFSEINADTTLYVTVSSATLCANKGTEVRTAKVTMNRYAIAGDLQVFDTSACYDETVQVRAQSTKGTDIKWYSDEQLNNLIATGPTYTTDAIRADTFYYVTITADSLCQNKAGYAARVNVKNRAYAGPDDLAVKDTAVCVGGIASLLATTNTGGAITWYADSTLLIKLVEHAAGVSGPYTTQAIEGDSTYYVTVSGADFCANRVGSAAVVKVKKKEYAVAGSITAPPYSVCVGSAADLKAEPSASSGPGVIVWYKDATLTDTLAIGDQYKTAPIYADATYYVAISSNQLCANKPNEGLEVSVVKKEYANPIDIAAADAAVCEGSIANLSASSTVVGDLSWYSDRFLRHKIGSGTSYISFPITADTTFYVTVSSTTLCANEIDSAAVVKVDMKRYALPEDLVVSDTAVCHGAVAILHARSAADTIRWYSDAALTTKVGEGATYNTAGIQADSAYYVTVSSAALCENKANDAVASLVKHHRYATRADLASADATACRGTVVNLGASSSVGTIRWYKASDLSGTAITGDSITINSLQQNEEYYLTVSNDTVCANQATEALVVKVKMNEYATAADVTSPDTSACKGSTVLLTATASGSVINWYNDYELKQHAGTGPTLVSATIDTNKVYYVTTSSTDLCANKTGSAKAVTILKKEYATALDIEAEDGIACIGTTTMLHAISNGDTIRWYRNPQLTDLAGEGPDFTTDAITGHRFYYITTKGSTLCANRADSGAVVKVVKREYATAANITVTDTSACRGTTVRLNASSEEGASIVWYSNATLTDSIGWGKQYFTGAIESDMTYYLSVSTDSLCANKSNAGADVVVKVNEYALATEISLRDTATCRGSSVELRALSAAGNTIKWYADSSLTSSIATGPKYVTGNIERNTTFYVTASNDTLCENKASTGALVTVRKKEYAAANDIDVAGVSVCKGTTAFLTATASAENIKWYSDASLNTQVQFGATYRTPVINENTTYYLTTYGTELCANDSANTASVLVKKMEYAVAANIYAEGVAVCEGSEALLSANTDGNVIQWYSDRALTHLVSIGDMYKTAGIGADSTYYLTTTSDTLCANKEGEAAEVMVRMKKYAVSADLNAPAVSVCDGNVTVLTATARTASTTDTIRWYSDAALTQLIATGRTYTTDTIRANRDYYVSVASNALCANQANAGAVVRVTKNDYATDADISVVDTTICRGGTIALSANSNITGGSLEWFVDEKMEQRVAIGENYTSEILTENTTYYIKVSNMDKCANKPYEGKPLHVNMRDKPVVTLQPRGIGGICETRGTAYAVEAKGDYLTYQWQIDKADGSWWTDIPGETGSQLSIPKMTLDMDGYRYRCIIRNLCGEDISGIVINSVRAAPTVTGNPEDKLVCEKQDAVFAVAADGYGTLRYLWQVDKKDGKGFVNIAGIASENTYTAAAVTETMNGYLFRCIVTGGCAPSDTSTMAALTVPVAKIGALNNQILCNNAQTQAVNLTSSLTGTTFTWVNTNAKVGLAEKGDGEVIAAFTAVNKGTAADSALITVTPVAQGCTGPEKAFTIRVNPTPLISSDAPADLCSDQPFRYAVKSETDKTAFTWTRAAVTGISNAAANGTGNIAETLVNNSTEPVAVTYSYSLTADGCINVQPVKVTVKPTPVATITGKDVCAEETLTLAGSADLKDVSYEWTDVAGKQSTDKNIVITNAAANAGGIYQLTVAKAGCSSVPARYTQRVKPLPVATITSPAGICEGQEIVISGSSDIGADSYIWSGPSGFVNDQPSFTLKNARDLYQGTYNLVVVKDGCKSHAAGSVVQVHKYPVVTVETSGLACENSTAWMKAYSNLPLSTFVWQGMGATSLDQQMTIKPVTGDILKYYVTVSRNGCAVRDSVEFVVKKSPAVTMPSIADVCQSVPAFNLVASETTGIAGKGVFSGAGVNEAGLFNPTIAAGTYVINYTYTSEEGCKDAKSVSFKVYPIPGVEAGADKTVYEGNSVRLDGYISGTYTKYAWSTPAGLALPTMNSLTPTITPTENTTYLLAAENSYGCRAVDSVNVSVLKFRVPNSFSPNGDGFNDNWNIPGLSKYPNSRVEIYNRWGTRLFLSKGYTKAWDGRYNGSYVPAATYYYLIYLNDGTGKEKPIAGWVEVMR